MASIPDNIAPLGTHRFLDQLNLGYHRLVAAHLLADPDAVINQARSNLRRWLADYEPGSGDARAFEEWQHLLETLSVSELAKILIEDSDEGQRLRSSTPFRGILSSEERKELRSRYEKAATN
ncbi:MAG TPA: hypothetical protein PLD20_19125 [Blastocatellia bacterium]|nr:hypothetical protein [Blastocatellia bacterium]HMV86427.1 hypothetical protein [Blastocatellia bacterium]HMX27041.1 hypothetical protein [Blastocatellia bacterium]HMY73349.1 hypothetical protein [Blastocatellia bacterium]HMZ20059.1 hypothetical protein [Blastocatellia bacterium]